MKLWFPKGQRRDVGWPVWRKIFQRAQKNWKWHQSSIQEIIWALIRINTKESLSKHIVAKTKERKIIAIKKKHIIFKRITMTMTADITTELRESRRQWNDIFNGLKDNTNKILFPAKYPLKWGQNRDAFTKQNLGELITQISTKRNTNETPINRRNVVTDWRRN